MTVQHAKLADEIAEVEIRGALGNPELDGDVMARHSMRREVQALELAR
jgi:hypothetical protein